MKETWDKLLDLLSRAGAPHEWALCLICIFGGAFVAWFASRKIAKALESRLFHKQGELGKRIVAAISGPLTIVVFSFFLVLGFDQFDKLPKALSEWLHQLRSLLTVCAIFLFALRAVDIGVELFRRKFAGSEGTLDESWSKLISVLGKLVVGAFGVLYILQTLGVNIIPLLTGAGFLGAAFALASQSTIANAIGSFEIMMDRLFREGDRISFGEYDGFVTRMGLRSIELRSLTGEKINLPNKDLVDKQIRNYTNRKRHTALYVTYNLTYSHSREKLERAIEVLREVVGKHRLVSQVIVNFQSLSSYSLDLQVIAWADYKDHLEHGVFLTEINLSVKEAFDREGFDFAFPTSTLHVHHAK